LPLSLEKRRIPLLDLAALHAPLRNEIIAALTHVVDSQSFILGDDVKELEHLVAQYCDSRFAIACASGSDALFLALMAAGIGPGDRVVTTPYSFFATAGAITRIGAIPVFADIDPATFNIDVSVCMSCQICVEVCPFDAIEMDNAFELSTTDRFRGLLWNREELAKPNSYFHKIHPVAAAEVDERLATAKAKAEAKAKPVGDAAASTAPQPDSQTAKN